MTHPSSNNRSSRDPRGQVSSAAHIMSRAGQERILECMLIVICVGLAALLHVVVGYKMVVLNLFYLPVVLAAFFLGRLRAGTLALFCVLMVCLVAIWDLPSFAAQTTPVIIGLSLTVWAAVMGLNAIIVGTLSDERFNRMADLHDANLGIVEVLARYLQSADRAMNDRSNRVATLSQSVARQLRMSEHEVDDIRVAARLRDMSHIEVTAEVIQRACGEIDHEGLNEPYTFQGSDLVQSLGAALTSAMPMIVASPQATNRNIAATEIPFGAAIIQAVHQFDTLVYDPIEPCPPLEAVKLMETELDGDFHPAVLHALSQTIVDLPERAAERLDAIDALVELEH